MLQGIAEALLYNPKDLNGCIVGHPLNIFNVHVVLNGGVFEVLISEFLDRFGKVDMLEVRGRHLVRNGPYFVDDAVYLSEYFIRRIVHFNVHSQ